jgi:hypothetical protein
MAEQLKEESQKTVVSFIVGLLIGGLLVWAFSGKGDSTVKPADKTDEVKTETSTANPTETKTTDVKVATDTKKPTAAPVATLPVGDGKVVVGTVAAGMTVPLDSATFPTPEGWVGVRDYTDGNLGGILGVARFSAAQGLVPKEITLLRAMVSGKQYAIVFYTENGDRKFNLAEDKQLNKEIATFTAK